MVDIPRDPLFDRLAEVDGLGQGVVPRFVRVSGRVSESAPEGTTRLHDPNDFGTYIDIPTSKIREVERDGEAITAVWMEPDAELEWHSVAHARFLAGEIASRRGGEQDYCPRSGRWPP